MLQNLNRNLISLHRYIHRRRPFWLGPSPSKYWYVPKEKPPQDIIEQKLLEDRWDEYTWKYESVINLFKQEYQLIKSQEEKESNSDDIHLIDESIIKENEQENAYLTKKRIDEEYQLHLQSLEYQNIRKEGVQHQLQLEDAQSEAEIAQFIEDSKNFIDPNNLEEEIEKMLSNVVSYDFTLDIKGNVKYKNQVS